MTAAVRLLRSRTDCPAIAPGCPRAVRGETHPSVSRMSASRKSPVARLLCALVFVLAFGLHAPEARTHVEPGPAAVGSARLEPRVEAVSPEVELIGLYEAGTLRVHVARFATLEPLAGASVGVEAGGQAARGTTDIEGMVRLAVPWLASPGPHPLLFTLASGDIHDLLSGTLEIPEREASAVASAAHGHARVSVATAAAAAGGLALGAFGAGWWLGRRRRRAAVAVFCAAVLTASMTGSPSLRAHEAAPTAATASTRAPARQADGSLFVPVTAQRALGLRTVETVAGAAGVAVELAGTVVADPAASGRVQAPVAGRVEPGPRGLPVPGTTVTRGETLAWLVPTITPIERGAQQARIAELDALIEAARARVGRYDQLAGSLPQRDIDQARSDLVGLERRRAALVDPLAARVPLVAPTSGVVSRVAMVAGQVVDARDLLLELGDPSRLLIEALAYDPRLARDIASASAQAADGSLVRLQWIGAAGELRQQALPLMFRVVPGPRLVAGQPVRVHLQTRRQYIGHALPPSALARTASGEPVVWVKTAGERFEPRRVQARPLAADRLLVTGEIADGDRVVVTGASLLSQVR